MVADKVLEQALKLDPPQRFKLVEEILQSLDQPDPAMDAIWIDEAERRLAAYRSGNVKAVPGEDVFGAL